MNAPFPPSGGPNPSGDEPELRSLLEAEARRQPPVSSDLRAGVDRRVRRHRTRLIAAIAPVIVLVVVGAALLAPRTGSETIVDTASEPTGQTDGTTPATDTTIPATDTTVAAPDPAAPTGDPVPAVPTGEQQDCGSIEIGPDRVDPEAVPLDCFIAAFNAGTDARLVVLVAGPDGGQLTETVTTAPGKTVKVVVDGSLTVKIPDLSFGKGGGGMVEDDAGGEVTDCGTVTVTDGAPMQELNPSSETMRCLIGLVTSGTDGGFTLVVNDATGGTLTTNVDLADGALTMAVSGTATKSLPELAIPSDLTSHLPPNGFGLDHLGLGGGGGGGLFPGTEEGD